MSSRLSWPHRPEVTRNPIIQAEAFSELQTQWGDFPELALFVMCAQGTKLEVGGEDTFSFQPRKQNVPTSKAKSSPGRSGVWLI